MVFIIPVEKNKEYEIEIESVTSEGMGVGHIDGFCIFVDKAVTGDVLKVLIVKVKTGYAYAKILNIIKKSPYRTDAMCSVYTKCGGCQLMHIDYDYQLKIKENIINDCLKRIGKLDVKVSEMIGAENRTRYRNKMIFPFGKDKNGNAVCGFYRERSHDVVEIDDCFLGNDIISNIVKTVMDYVKKYHISIYDEKNHKGFLRRLFIRQGFNSKEIMVVISANGDKLKNKEELIKNICKISSDIKGIILNINTKKTNNVLGDANVLLYGNQTISDYLCGLKYEISVYSFFQINPYQTEKLYKKAIEFADINNTDYIMDIYCGIGTISLTAAQKAKKVIGVEIVEQAIIDARKNAIENDIKNVSFYAEDAAKMVPELIEKGEKPDVVILDPPRKGSDEKTLSAIVMAKPKKIVYVSCNPSTLARDLRFLCDRGYEVKKVTGVDMFPQTAHVECVVRLCRT